MKNKFSILFKDLDDLDLEKKYLKIKAWLTGKTRDAEDLQRAIDIGPDIVRLTGILYAMCVNEEDLYNLKTKPIISRIKIKAEKELIIKKRSKETSGQITEAKVERFIYANNNERYIKIMRLRAKKKKNSLILLALKGAVDARWHLLQTQTKFISRD